MTRVNLLPHREEARRARRQQFYSLAGMVAALGLLIIVLGYTVISGYIGAQAEKNAFLKKEIDLLDKDIGEIKRLREQTQALLSRKQIIEDLQRDRGEPVYLLSELASRVPEGVYLKSVRQDGLKINLTGMAQTGARVSALMTALDASPWLERPELLEIKAVNDKTTSRRYQEFNLNILLTRTAPAEAAKDKK